LRKLPPEHLVALHHLYRGAERGLPAPVAYDADKFPDEIHFYLSALEDASGIEPQFHVFAGEQVPWIALGDDLPKYLRGTSGPKLED
jgi:hypothetical protein